MEVNIHQAKTHLSRLLVRVAGGEEITIAKAGVPVARLVPVKAKSQSRRLDTEAGSIWIADDFDAPTPEIDAMFEGRPERGKRKRRTR